MKSKRLLLKISLSIIFLLDLSVLTASSEISSGEGILIKEIHVLRFPMGRNGKNFDKNNYPDIYAQLYTSNKKTSKSNVSKDCRKGRIPILSGGKMPFRIEQNGTYHIQLMDHDSDRGIGRNRDEEISSKILITWRGLISKFGQKNTYLIKDPRYSDVQFLLMVEHVDGKAAAGKSAYVRFVKPIDQKYVAPKKKVLEGCGPVAAAMLMGYWHTEHRYPIMNPADRFDGTKHPTQTILDFRKKANTKAWGDQEQSATRKIKMEDALGYFVNQTNKRIPSSKAKLKVDMLWSIRRWSERRDRLKKELREGSPVILLLKEMPPCLKGRWVNATKVVGDHYIVAVGFDDTKKEYYVMPGWWERPKSTSIGPEVHKAQDSAHCKCSYSEIQRSDPSLIWIKR